MREHIRGSAVVVVFQNILQGGGGGGGGSGPIQFKAGKNYSFYCFSRGRTSFKGAQNAPPPPKNKPT